MTSTVMVIYNYYLCVYRHMALSLCYDYIYRFSPENDTVMITAVTLVKMCHSATPQK